MQGNNIAVSVCMITYNHEGFIRKSLDSILMQKTNFEYEIVIGEDYSKDSTREICIEYRNNYPDKINLILREKNLGIIDNSLDTIQKCRGIYIAYLEGDDYWINENKLQMQFDFLEKNKDYGLVYTNYNNALPNLNIKKEAYKGYNMESGFVLKGVLRGGFPRLLMVFHRRNLIEDDFFEFVTDERILTLDFVLFVYLANKAKFKYLDSITAQYNYNNASMTKEVSYSKRLEYHKSGRYILLKFLRTYKVNDSIRDYIDNHLIKREKTTFYHSIKAKNKEEAQKSLEIIYKNKKSIRYNILKIIIQKDFGISLLSFMYNVSILSGLIIKLIKNILTFDKANIVYAYNNLKTTFSKYFERLKHNK